MTPLHVLILALTGLVTGFASGILGLGGAFIMTPLQFWVFTDMGISQDLAIKMAFGTSLMVVLPTAISGALRHHREAVVHWKTAAIMGGCAMLAALLGATLAAHLPGEALRLAFGVVLLGGAVWMLIHRNYNVEEEPRQHVWSLVLWAIPIGLVSGILGVGGGIIAVPILILVLKFKMHDAAATSLATVIFSSLGGIVGYIANGIGVSGLPPYSWGYVYLPAWGLLVVTSVAMAQVGAFTMHRLPARALRYLFIAVMLFMALRMLGAFAWLGWNF